MQFIKHRVNKISDLSQVDPNWGVEIDIRSNVSHRDSLHLSHDPWDKGDDFLEWLDEYKRLGIQGPIILNTKEDALENCLLNYLANAGLTHFFFLDTTIPTLVKLCEKGLREHLCVRLSKYEPLENIELFRGKVEWIWLDCFHGNPIFLPVSFNKGDYKICIVSPELHTGKTENLMYFDQLFSMTDFVCTKHPRQWQERESRQ